MTANSQDAVQRLTQEVRDALRSNIVNHYTCLQPRLATDGSQTIIVKDGRDRGVLEIVVRRPATNEM